MFKRLRIPVVVMLVLGSVLCALWAKPKVPPKGGKDCELEYNSCLAACKWAGGTTFRRDKCQRECYGQYLACEKKKTAAISVGPQNPVPDGTLVQTSTPAPSPKSKLPTTGPLSQVSPSVAPSRHVPQPQGTLTQTSPSPSPNRILHERKKEKKK